ncbi:hypothetical protein CDL15_Pgr011792 [Punica granatum]|uniref:Uncharacterized protein n=1 Tax=Punica granatum TaxID=22663 RepID=A0A218XEE3_PUNGR|nr:hypothetical protein CDL15_Pgr011792 [Punica granatum]
MPLASYFTLCSVHVISGKSDCNIFLNCTGNTLYSFFYSWLSKAWRESESSSGHGRVRSNLTRAAEEEREKEQVRLKIGVQWSWSQDMGLQRTSRAAKQEEEGEERLMVMEWIVADEGMGAAEAGAAQGEVEDEMEKTG